MRPLGARLAQGRTAEIYAWGDGQVLKLFRDWAPPDLVSYEAGVARSVQNLGLPVPAVGEIVELDGRRGLVYERLAGKSLLQNLLARPWTLLRAAHLLAELHTKIHLLRAPGLPSQRLALEAKIQFAQPLSPELRQAALQVLSRLPDSDRLCHGDFHPGNVLLTPSGPRVIDWVDATSGNPLADVARTYVLFHLAGQPAGASAGLVFRMIRAGSWRAYLKRYFQIRPASRQELAGWLPVVAAARLSEDIPEEQERVLDFVRAHLQE